MSSVHPEKIIKVPVFEEAKGFYTTRARSLHMAKIKSKETKPEIRFRKALWNIGIRYRKNAKKLPGKPDIVISKYRIVIFIDGEFWHGYNWAEKKKKIKSNRDYWIPKIERNMQRDWQNDKILSQQGWKVLRFWEQQIKKEFGSCLFQVLKIIDEQNQGTVLLKRNGSLG